MARHPRAVYPAIRGSATGVCLAPGRQHSEFPARSADLIYALIRGLARPRALADLGRPRGMTGSGAGVRLGNRPADGRRPERASWQVDAVDIGQARRNRRRSVRQLWRRFIVAIRDGDERMVEQAVLQLAGRRKIFAPLALIVGAFVTLFSALRLLVTNWR
jgi:hypothetical protein